jgi:hypothetical protein
VTKVKFGKGHKNSEDSEESKKKPSLSDLMVLPIATLLISTLVLILMPFLIKSTSLTFPITVVFGIITLVSTLVIGAVILQQLDLGCKFEALGLPAGSIRSLIALSLVIIFVMLAIYLYPELKPTVTVLPSNYTYVYPNGTIINAYNSTSVLTEPSEVQKNFSLQALTTVSTLVVAIASFYFGAKAVESGRKLAGSESTTAKTALSTNPSSPANATKGAPLIVELSDIPEEVVIDTWGIYGDPTGRLLQNEYGRFEYSPSEEAQETVLLYFGSKKNRSARAELEVKVREKKRSEEADSGQEEKVPASPPPVTESHQKKGPPAQPPAPSVAPEKPEGQADSTFAKVESKSSKSTKA